MMTTGNHEPGARATGQRVCPDCNGELVPTYWLASVGEYPAKEVVRVPGIRCVNCNYVRFEYDPHPGNTVSASCMDGGERYSRQRGDTVQVRDVL